MEAFNAIHTYQLLWICGSCRKRLTCILDMGKRVEARIDKAEKHIIKVVAEAKQETTEVMDKKVQGQLKRMEEQAVKQLDLTSETLKRTVQNQEKLVERSNNLIIHGLKESDESDGERQREDDTQKIMEIARAVCGDDANLKVSRVIRLRRKQEVEQKDGTEKPRLMLIKFATKEDATKLFQKKLGLRDAGFPNVYINRDLSMEEREKQHKLRVELRAKGRETHRIFRGRVVPRDE